MINMDSKAMQMILSTVIKSLGIDGPSLIANIQQFQAWVVNAVQHHDNRLVALESIERENSAKLDRILILLGENHERNDEQRCIGHDGGDGQRDSGDGREYFDATGTDAR